MTGEIYLITNKVNGKQYIGKTTQGFEYRFSEHIRKAYAVDYVTCDYIYNHKFYRALRKYGSDNFYIELLGTFDLDKLNQKEVEYIAKYNTYYSGYNSTVGGAGCTKLELSDSEIRYITDTYKSGLSAKNIGNELGVSGQTILRILKSVGIEIRRDSNYPLRIVMYDKQFNPIRVFNSKREIVKWLDDSTDYAINLHSIYGLITRACQNGNIAYGHRWQLLLELQYDNKVFRTRFDRDAYIDGEEAYKPDGKEYWIVDGVLNNIIKLPKENTSKTRKHIKCKEYNTTVEIDRIRISYKSKTTNKDKNKICLGCGCLVIATTKDGLCNSCANVAAKGKSPKPSKEELKSLLDRNIQVKQIAKMYDRSQSTVSTWIKQYSLKYK
ncbi:MAG: hypothetical protein J6A59_06600 [Lachnospiraceae bacterium]|nr:hypothetical protein [Lachnospiraceae bacterium]